jgi:hypothetical protein
VTARVLGTNDLHAIQVSRHYTSLIRANFTVHSGMMAVSPKYATFSIAILLLITTVLASAARAVGEDLPQPSLVDARTD